MSSVTKIERLRRLGFRITAWYAAVFCATVVAFSLFLYFRLEHDLCKQHDKFLSLESKEFAGEVLENLGDLATIKKKLELEIGTQTRPNIVYRLFTPEGVAVAQSEFFPDDPEPEREAGFIRKAMQSESPLPPWMIHASTKYPYRVTAHAVLADGKAVYIIATGYSLRLVWKTLRNYRRNFFRFLLPLVLLGIAGGWWLARKSLAPIADMTRAAQAISRESLQKRIPVKGTGDELDQLAHVLNEMLGRLQESFERIERFSSDLAHELRTPLTALKGEAESALMGARSAEELRTFIAGHAEMYERLNGMISDLLMLSREGTESAKPQLAHVDVAACVRETADTFAPLAEEAGVKLTTSCPDAPCVVEGNGPALGRLFSNLLDNAIKHTPAGGEVGALVEAQDACTITVRDTGDGIAPEDLPHVFERFCRGDPARSRETGGFGLGLSICKQIAEDHLGSISIKSEPGKGTEVTVRLPLGADRSPSA